MNTITINNAISNFPQIVNNTIKNFEETLIVGDQGAVVLISQQEWDSMMETIRLLRDKKSLKSLIEGQNIRKKGLKSKGKTITQAFYDIQDTHS